MSDSPPNQQKRSFSWVLWIPLILLAPFFFLMLVNTDVFPPAWYERRGQEQKLTERVLSAGGWDAVRRDRIVLAEQHTSGFYYTHFDTNDLPKSITVLRPLSVMYSAKNGCVRMRIFGIHATGGHSTPYFGLEVDTSTNSMGYEHGTGYDNGGVIGNHHSIAKPVAHGIYEIY